MIFAIANDVIYDMKKIGKENYSEEKAILFLEPLHPGKSYDVPDPWGRNEKILLRFMNLSTRLVMPLSINMLTFQNQIK